MTLNRLHKLLGELIAQGHGRRDVYVDKSSFRDNRENDGVCIMPVSEIDIQTYELADDDGGWAFDSRGRVKERTSLVIYGGCRERPAPETSSSRCVHPKDARSLTNRCLICDQQVIEQE